MSVVPRPLAALALATACAPFVLEAGSIRFFGTGSGDVDRVKLPVGTAPGLPSNPSGSFTLEFWMKPAPGNAGTVAAGSNGWITGNVIWDRDVYGGGDYGDWGVSLGSGRLAFGAAVGDSGATVVTGAGTIPDGVWTHVAVTRDGGTGALAIYLDGALAASGAGPAGDISYRVGRSTPWPNDPHLVLGAEKHDAGAAYPSYRGLIDDARLSSGVRHTSAFVRPSGPHPADAATLALWRFDETSGTVAADAASASGGPTPGTLFVGGPSSGPAWSAERAFPGEAGTSFRPLAPCRVVDTRNPDGPLGGPALAAGAARTFEPAGSCGIPFDAVALSLNVTVTQPSSAGELSLFPAGEAPPVSTSLSFGAGRTRANNALVGLSAGFSAEARLPSGTVHLIVDVNGYFQ